jgi:hypothetical protein
MQHVVAMQLQPAADERRPDRSLHRLIVLEVPLGRDPGRLAEHDADDERTLLDPASAALRSGANREPAGRHRCTRSIDFAGLELWTK